MSLLFVTLTRRRVFSFLVLTIFLTLLPQDITARIQTPYHPPNSPQQISPPSTIWARFISNPSMATGSRGPSLPAQTSASLTYASSARRSAYPQTTRRSSSTEATLALSARAKRRKPTLKWSGPALWPKIVSSSLSSRNPRVRATEVIFPRSTS